MARHEIETPNYVGIWTCKNSDPKSSLFMAFVGWRTKHEREEKEEGKMFDFTEEGRMFDFKGVSNFKISKRGEETRVSIKYIPSLSEGFSGGIDCAVNGIEGFFRGTWEDGEFSATKFENISLCNNYSVRLLFEEKYNLLVEKMIETTREIPFSPLIKNIPNDNE